ncbi:hypothetical protein F4819DRAFT_475496 [Hypoxylon fuscum]|nr:hypothetical protein F4819DRAFT_475496 [Hypoxylon fuscum]
MSQDSGVVKDTSLPLSQIRDTNSASVISSVLDIQRYAVTRDNWLKSLECLYLAADNEEPSVKRRRVSGGSVPVASSELFRRRHLNPFSDDERERNYIAVSYTWKASKEEGEDEETVGRYLVESRRAGEPALPTNVRDTVWTRVLNYAEHVGCDNIWIDRECVDQKDGVEKEAAIQSMHLVYSLSRKPIALLTRTIETAKELDLLTNLLCGEVNPQDEPATLSLINDITSNLWWTRAWTFHEDYRASARMFLLIPHHRSLETRKDTATDLEGRPILGNVEGEICIRSMDFKKYATGFCLSYRKKIEDSDICDRILKAAAQYNILLEEQCSLTGFWSVSRSMSPIIVSDIISRDIMRESDRLAIMANCCGYSTRLDTNTLNSKSSSLSLSILALYLLNGEILENSPKKEPQGSINDTVYEYLSKQSLNSFRPPIDEGLTFIKSCRFVDPKLTTEGTITRGHLWKLSKVIRRKPMKWDKYRSLKPLAILATELNYQDYGRPYPDLATRLLEESYDRSPPRDNRQSPRRWEWRRWMTDEVEEALVEGKVLRLGRLVHPKYKGEDSTYRAIFVGNVDDDWDENIPSWAFTSTWPAKSESDIHKHVSLEVDVEFPERAPPKLHIKRWLNGLCFFEGSPQRDVLFPWPSDLLK